MFVYWLVFTTACLAFFATIAFPIILGRWVRPSRADPRLRNLLRYRVILVGGIVRWPSKCICCGNTPDSSIRLGNFEERGVGIRTRTEWSIEAPYCKQCWRHKTPYSRANSLDTTALAIYIPALLFGFIVLVTGVLPYSYILFVPAACIPFGLLRLRSNRHVEESYKYLTPTCCTADSTAAVFQRGNIRRFGRSTGQHEFRFRNAAYAESFAVMNRSSVSLINEAGIVVK